MDVLEFRPCITVCVGSITVAAQICPAAVRTTVRTHHEVSCGVPEGLRLEHIMRSVVAYLKDYG